MWIAIWIFLILALIVVPAVFLIWAVKQAFVSASRVGQALSRIGSDIPEVPEIAPEDFYPGAAMSTHQRAQVMNLRRKLKRQRAQAIVSRGNQALLRWQRIGFLSSGTGDTLEAQFVTRGRRGERG